MLPTHHTNQTPPSSPPSSPFPPSSSPPSSPSLDPFALDSDDDESSSALSHSYTLGEPASGSSEALEQGLFGNGFGYGYTSEGAPMDPLAGAYRPYPYRNAKRARVARVACSPGQTPMKKKAGFRSRSPVGWGRDGIDVYLGEGVDGDGEVTVDTGGGGRVCNVDLEVAAALEEERERKRQKALWDSALEEAFESGEVKIDLTDKNIVDIPSEVVRDLAKFVVLSQKNEPVPQTMTMTALAVEAVDDIRAGMASSNGNGHGPAGAPRSGFARTQTAPATSIGAWARQGPSAKAVSTGSILGVSREAMDIFLGRNNIAKLPMELWSLHNLTVLSLRNNCLTYIPPEIANLRDLQTLNLAHNKLRYIPSEMLQMKKLTQLNLFPNPFLPKPPPNRDGNYVSRTERIGPKIPPLTELALRVLLLWKKGTRETVLEQYYELPLATSQDQRPVTAFRDILSICVPGSVLPDESRAGRKQFEVARPVTGVGICPNPMHDDESNFIRPSEERYTWVESTPAMKTKGAESGGLGGHAAVHWRGCMWSCLDFLGIAGEDEDTKKKEKEAEEEGMDLDLQESEEVVQTVRFDTATGWDFDD